MKITKTGNLAAQLHNAKIDANVGCQKCPCCGETKDVLDYLEQGVTNKGIMRYAYRSFAKGIFFLRIMKCDCYACETCGAEWESDPYKCG